MLHKKGESGAWSFLIRGLLFTIISLIILLTLLSFTARNADIEGSLAICKASIILAEKATDFTSVAGKNTFEWGNLCKKHDLIIPEKDSVAGYEMTKEDAMLNIAERTADCWNEFGEGMIDMDLFGESVFGNDRCFTCFSFSLGNLAQGETITLEELTEFMGKNPYKVRSADLDYCSDEVQGECVKKTESLCVRKGGVCEEGCDISTKAEYSKWSCHGKKEKCCVKRENFISYMEYVYMYKGPGMILFDNTMDVLETNTEYSISFVSDTSKTTAGTVAWGTAITGTAITGVLVSTTVTIAGTVGTIASFIPGPGWVVAGIAFGIGAVVSYSASELIDWAAEDPQLIIISKSSAADQFCNVQTGVDGR